MLIKTLGTDPLLAAVSHVQEGIEFLEQEVARADITLRHPCLGDEVQPGQRSASDRPRNWRGSH